MTSTLKANTIEPAGSSLTLGASGDTVVIGNNDIRANTYKDAGGNTLFTSDGSGNLSSVRSGFGGSLKLLSTQVVPNFLNGNRQSDTTVTCNFNWAFTSAGDHTGNGLINGNHDNNDAGDNGWFPDTASVAGRTIQFDFGTGKVYKACQWVSINSSASEGTWKWQGSNDASSWTDIGSSFTLGGNDSGSSVINYYTLGDTLNGNTTSYRYYRILGISGNGNTSGRRLGMYFSETATQGAATVDFTSGIDSTYAKYIFKFYNVQSTTNAESFGFQANASGQSGFNETITSIYFRQYNQENDGSTAAFGTQGASPSSQANGTVYNNLIYAIGNEKDECGVGELHLYNPAGTTFAKMWHARCNSYAVGGNDLTYETMIGGYFNVTAAITQISFKMTSGNIANGTIKLYGVL